LKGDIKLELGGRIRELRDQAGLSQEALAGRIFVTRQTILNWEAGRSYPDAQSLLMLSAVFDVSLDELIKGDIDVMKQELDSYKMRVWLVCSIILLVVALALAPIFLGFFGAIGWLFAYLLLILAALPLVIVNHIAKKHNLIYYSEIIAFASGRDSNTSIIAWLKRHEGLLYFSIPAAGALAGFLAAWFYPIP
jgi:transcriptional regulator with XRE-family HTH domain